MSEAIAPIQPPKEGVAPQTVEATATPSASPPPEATPESGNQQLDLPASRTKSYMRVKIGSLEFSSLEGDILGQPWIALRTHQYSTAKFILNDPNDELRPEILKQDGVEIEIGFVGSESQNIFVGKIYAVGRVHPDGTEVEAVDPSASMQGTGASVQFQSERPASTSTTPQPDQGSQATENSAQNQDDSQGSDPAESSKFPEPTNRKGEVEQGGVTETPDADEPWAAMQQLLEQVGEVVKRNRLVVKLSEQATGNFPGLKFADDSALSTFLAGTVRSGQGQLQSAQKEAKSMGEVVVARGNTIRQVAPGNGTTTGIVLDYTENRSAFRGRPKIIKRTGLQLAGPVGALTVAGWSPNDKRVVSSTVVTPGAIPNHPTGVVTVPDWGDIKLSDPIIPNGIYTWADATKNGDRVPASKEVMQKIALIAQLVQPLTDKTVGVGNKWTVTSWYRDPATNRRVGGAPNSRHTYGDAIDFYFPGMNSLFQELNANWDGGVAQKRNSFTHIDAHTRRRWSY